MTRTDQDSWDLASSVGATATMVAAARALASQGTEPIIDDPFAAPLVRAVGLEFFRRLVDGEVAPADAQDGERDLQLETDSIAVRTRFFDDFFLNAARDGIRQSVILAAGLDARAYRLSWPPGSVVYEVDQPKVVGFKTAAMAGAGRHPDRGPADRQRRSARRLAGSVAAQRFRPDATDLLERGGPADVPAARSPGPAFRQHHRAQRARKHAGHRIPRRFRPHDDRTRAAVQPAVGQHGMRHRPVGTVLRRRAQQRRGLPDRPGLAGDHPASAGSTSPTTGSSSRTTRRPSFATSSPSPRR